MATTVNYDDERFAQVESDKQEALNEVEKVYGGMIEDSDNYYQSQIDASKDWANQQQQIQQEQTDFAIEQIEQQKEQSQKDYTKEQAGSYVDWQKQSNKYGANAEQMAAAGLTGTGFSESSQVSMYNTYQNRVAVARESFNQAVLNYNNSIKDAQLQNSAALAEIAYNALQQQLQLSLEMFQYKNNLLLELTNQKQQIESEYYDRWMDVVNQINTENALAEEIRQFNAQMAKKSSGSGGSGSSSNSYTISKNNENSINKNATTSGIVGTQALLNDINSAQSRAAYNTQKAITNIANNSSSSKTSSNSSTSKTSSNSSSSSKKTGWAKAMELLQKNQKK